MTPRTLPVLAALVLALALALPGCHGSLASRYTRLTTGPRLDLQAEEHRGVDPGPPLFLTPLIESGNVTGAQLEAAVKPLYGKVQSFSGFLTVNKALGSNMFFWYFPAERAANKAPVVLWLQGGPGASSLYGLFSENGPFVCVNGKVSPRKYSWNTQYNLLYIDNPVGAGYSFTEKDEGYARNQTQVSGSERRGYVNPNKDKFCSKFCSNTLKNRTS